MVLGGFSSMKTSGTLVEVLLEREQLSWIWTSFALLSSLLPLFGYAIVPPTLNKFAHDPTGAKIASIVLIVIGTTASGLLYLLSKNVKYRLECLAKPNACGSFIGFFLILYNSNHKPGGIGFHDIAIALTVLSLVSLMAWLALAVRCMLKLRALQERGEMYLLRNSSTDKEGLQNTRHSTGSQIELLPLRQHGAPQPETDSHDPRTYHPASYYQPSSHGSSSDRRYVPTHATSLPTTYASQQRDVTTHDSQNQPRSQDMQSYQQHSAESTTQPHFQSHPSRPQVPFLRAQTLPISVHHHNQISPEAPIPVSIPRARSRIHSLDPTRNQFQELLARRSAEEPDYAVLQRNRSTYQLELPEEDEENDEVDPSESVEQNLRAHVSHERLRRRAEIERSPAEGLSSPAPPSFVTTPSEYERGGPDTRDKELDS